MTTMTVTPAATPAANLRRLLLASLAALLLLAFIPPAGAKDPAPPDGEVRVPLGMYASLFGRGGEARGRYALGRCQVNARVSEQEGRRVADVTVDTTVQTFDDGWTLVPVLPPGTAIGTASLDGTPAALTPTPEGSALAISSQGTHTLQLGYRVEAARSETGYTLALPVPRAGSTHLAATLPGAGIEPSVVPAVDVRTTAAGDSTQVTAMIPATSLLQLSWRAPAREGLALSRARYTGELKGDSIAWTAEYGVELFTGETTTLRLLPRSVTLADLRVDGKNAPALVAGDRFATVVRGKGEHTVTATFHTPVARGDGPPQVHLELPEVPVSRFDLTLPGKKEVTATPAASVVSAARGNQTVATLYVPMTAALTLTWVEAVPQEVAAEVNANASLYQILHAEEGVLHGRAICAYEITRGETAEFELEVPEGIQINRVVAPQGGIADWRAQPAQPGKPPRIAVFLDRKVKGEFTFEVLYERLLGTGPGSADRFPAPLLRATSVHRQRGMVALLSGPDLALRPVEEPGAVKVGENQLPAFVRDSLDMTVAHTYKYVDAPPRLVIQTVAPERKRGTFDAEVSTLVSIGEATLKGSATVEVDLKSGSIMALTLKLPASVNVLSLSAPSLRNFEVKPEGETQTVDVEFTQEMEGQFRLELNYERVLADAEARVQVPTASVPDAQVEHGRIAVEALAAVEVQADEAAQLSTVEASELPQQLVLKTTNPILLAYKYVHADPPHKLALRVTRHRQVEVQAAAIDRAEYRTLFTRDGLAVTAARLWVRNSRKQFLALELPPGSEVWSAFVAGRPEKPALAGPATGSGSAAGPAAGQSASAAAGAASSGSSAPGAAKPGSTTTGVLLKTTPGVLIKMINSAEGFPVDVVYATKVARVGVLGTLAARLPRPDMVVTATRWDVFLPDGLSYRRPTGNLELVAAGDRVDRKAMEAGMTDVLTRSGAAGAAGAAAPPPPPVEALRISVPSQGVHFAFEKLYANQSREDAAFSIAYASRSGALAGTAASGLGALLAWTGLLALAAVFVSLPRPLALGLLLAGVALVATAYLLGASPAPAIAVSLVLAALVAGRSLLARLGRAPLAGRPAPDTPGVP